MFVDADELRIMLRCFSIGTLQQQQKALSSVDGRKMPMPMVKQRTHVNCWNDVVYGC